MFVCTRFGRRLHSCGAWAFSSPSLGSPAFRPSAAAPSPSSVFAPPLALLPVMLRLANRLQLLLLVQTRGGSGLSSSSCSCAHLCPCGASAWLFPMFSLPPLAPHLLLAFSGASLRSASARSSVGLLHEALQAVGTRAMLAMSLFASLASKNICYNSTTQQCILCKNIPVPRS